MDTLRQNIYEDGSYLANNPTWHEEDAPFKAKYIFESLQNNAIFFKTIAEIGCGTGAVLKNVRKFYDNDDAEWKGFDIAGDAIAIAQRDKNDESLQFFHKDLLKTEEYFDVLLVIDVFEHVPDYMGFVREMQAKGALQNLPHPARPARLICPARQFYQRSVIGRAPALFQPENGARHSDRYGPRNHRRNAHARRN